MRQEPGGHPVFQGLQDPGVLRDVLQAGQGRRLEGEDADRPDEHEGEGEPEQAPAQPVQRRGSRAGEAVPERTTHRPGDDLPEHGEGEDATERYPGTVNRVPAFGQEGRRDPRPHRRPDDHADQREDPGEKPRPRSTQDRNDDEDADKQVQNVEAGGVHPQILPSAQDFYLRRLEISRCFSYLATRTTLSAYSPRYNLSTMDA